MRHEKKAPFYKTIGVRYRIEACVSLWLIALRSEGVEITRWQFFKTGLLVMPAALLVSVFALWITARAARPVYITRATRSSSD
ncbi:MAG: hypothetical protein WAM66_14595 [Acidobacteriaceae bacterium]